MGINVNYIKNSFLSALFVDIEGANDNVSLITTLIETELNIPSNRINLINNIVSNRKIFPSVKNTSFPSILTNKGLPQGSIVSPLLFNIYLFKIFHHIGPSTIILTFADDIVIYNSDPILQKSLSKIEFSLTSLDSCLQCINLKISDNKTQIVIFTKKPLPGDHPSISLNNITIPDSDNSKFGRMARQETIVEKTNKLCETKN